VKTLSPEEALDIAELRLSLITLAAKPAYRHLSPSVYRMLFVLSVCLPWCGLDKSQTFHFSFGTLPGLLLFLGCVCKSSM
jgi:hypothetical protein